MVANVDQRLNSGVRIILGSTVSAVILTYYIARLAGPLTLINQGVSSLIFLDLLLYFVPPTIYGYFAGVILWRLGVVLFFLCSIPKHFNIHSVTCHPDKAGGLDSVGYICVQLLVIASVPTIASALFLFSGIINAVAGHVIIQSGNIVLVTYSAPLILFVSIMGLLLGFLPLYSFGAASKNKLHEGVLARKEVAQKIVDLKKALLSRIENEDYDLSTALERLSYLSGLYQDSGKMRIWPLSSHRIKSVVALLGYYFSQIAAVWGV